ncbi:MAG: thermonuclease family protein [Hyphomicrobiaceae bacterium]
MQLMRELFGRRVLKTVLSLSLAGGLLAALFANSVARQSYEQSGVVVAGHPRVVDGDSLEFAGVHVRLEGIDAPELGQRCRHRRSRAWPAGRAAQNALRSMIAGRAVRCRAVGRGKYGRILGNCSIADLELNSEMVRRGFAWAFTRYSDSYVAEEEVARRNRVGIWRHRCLPAWRYRVRAGA